MASFLEIMAGAPWWVYVLLVYLVNIGIRSMQPRTISIQRVLFLPLVFGFLSVYSLYEKLLLGFFSLTLVWVVFLSCGAFLGVKEVRSWHFRTNHSKGEITIPGNYSTLVLVLSIFILKFFFGYMYATEIPTSYWIYFADTLSSSLVTGFFVGRAAVFFYRYRSLRSYK